jgi:hypothetical protein
VDPGVAIQWGLLGADHRGEAAGMSGIITM